MIKEYEPLFARVYGIKPWEMPRLSWPQFQRFRADLDRLLNPESR